MTFQEKIRSAFVFVIIIILVASAPVSTVSVVSAQSALDPNPIQSPSTVTAGENVSVSTSTPIPDLTPYRELKSDLKAEMYVDGKLISSNTFTVTEGQIASVSFNHSFNKTGTQDVKIDFSISIGGYDNSMSTPTATINVDPEPLATPDLSANLPTSTTINQPTNISSTIRLPNSIGINRSGNVTVSIEANGKKKDSTKFKLTDGSQQTINLSPTFNKTGSTTATIKLQGSIGGTTISDSVSETIDVDLKDAKRYLSLSPTIPQKTTTGNETNINTTISIGSGVSLNSNVAVQLLANGSVIANSSVSLSEGGSKEVHFTPIFNQSGRTNITLKTTVTIENQTVSKPFNQIIDIRNPSINQEQGAVFTVPTSLEDEINSYRKQVGINNLPRAFILATTDDLYIVFTNREPIKGIATVTGPQFKKNIDHKNTNVTFGAMAATSVSFDQTGNKTTVNSVYSNPSKYKLDLVRINATYRRLSSLTDPDVNNNITVAQTTGMLVENPKSATDLFNTPGKTGANFAINTSVEELNVNSTTEILDQIKRVQKPRLYTFNFEKKFWSDAPATVNAIALSPGSAAREYINKIQKRNLTISQKGKPLLYVVEEDFNPEQQSDVTQIKTNSNSLDGDVVSVDARLLQAQVSTQETVEHATTNCGETVVTIQTPSGPVACKNVPQDIVAHGGVAWDTSGTPTSRKDLLFVAGLSSTHSDHPYNLTQGRYRIVGEVAHTSRVDESLPDASILIVHNLTRKGDINWQKISEKHRNTIRNRSNILSDQLQTGANSTVSQKSKHSDVSAVNVTQVKNATTGFTDGNDDENVSIFRVNVEDSAGKLVETGSITFSTTISGDATRGAGSLDDDAFLENYTVSDGTAVGDDTAFSSVTSSSVTYDPSQDDETKGEFYVALQDSTEEKVTLEINPDSSSVAADSATAEFYQIRGVDVDLNESTTTTFATQPVGVTVTPNNGNGDTVDVPRLSPTVSSGNTTVVQVSGSSSPSTNVSGVATTTVTQQGTEGTADIESVLNNKLGTTTVTVSDPSYGLSGVSLTPSNVTENSSVEHNLQYTVDAASQDGNSDTHTITLPNTTEITSANINNVTDANGDVISISSSASLANANGGTNNELTFGVQPDSDFDTSAVDVDANVTVDFPNVSQQTTDDVNISVDDSDSGTTSAQTSITIEPASTATADFSLSNLSAPSTVTQNQSYTVDADVTNTGGAAGTQDVNYTFAGVSKTESSVQLDAGNSTTVSFNLSATDTNNTATGNYTHTVSTAGATDLTQNATVVAPSTAPAPANFTVSNVSPDGANVTQGDLINASADVENVGGQQATQTLRFRLDSNEDGQLDAAEELDNETVQLDAGNSTQVEFTNINTSVLPNSTVTYTHGVFSENDGATASITVEAQQPPQQPSQGPGDLTGDGNVATDPDGDGQYEDINGDGVANLQDLQPYFDRVRPSSAAPSTPSFFDYNGDGSANLQDLQPFFNEAAP